MYIFSDKGLITIGRSHKMQQQPATHLYSVKNILAIHFLAKVIGESRMAFCQSALAKDADGNDLGLTSLPKSTNLVRDSLSRLKLPL